MLRDEEEAGADAPPPALSPEKLEVVMKLFATWDYEGTGKLSISALKDVPITVGPREDKEWVNTLKLMDANGDGIVEESVRATQLPARVLRRG